MAKSEVKRALMDSSALLAVINGEMSAQRITGFLELIDAGEVQLVESTVILVEVFKKSTAADANERDRQDSKLNEIRALLESRSVELVDVTPPVARKAAELRARYRLEAPDAIHLATAIHNRCDWLVTLDTDFKSVAESVQVVLFELLDDSKAAPWETPASPPKGRTQRLDDPSQGTLFGDDNVVPLRP